ncbi:unnamed protein product, partial [Ectocarpus fasciculatus]
PRPPHGRQYSTLHAHIRLSHATSKNEPSYRDDVRGFGTVFSPLLWLRYPARLLETGPTNTPAPLTAFVSVPFLCCCGIFWLGHPARLFKSGHTTDMHALQYTHLRSVVT